MIYNGPEVWAATNKEMRLEVNEMRMLRCMCGVTQKYNISRIVALLR